MRTWVVVLGVMVVAVSVAAKPLPKGMKVEAVGGDVVVKQGAISIGLRDDGVRDYDKVTKAELTADGKTLEVTTERCGGTVTDDVQQISLAKVQARLDNAVGLAALAKKQYPAAQKSFASALKKDPETLAYASNLLAAQLLGKKPALAGQTLAMYGKTNPAWFGWQLAVDPNLAGATSLKIAGELLIAPTPGTATVGALGMRDIATSPLGGGMAALRTTSSSRDGAASAIDIDIVSLATGKLLARLPVQAPADACTDDAAHPCSDAVQQAIAARTKVVDNLLAAQGFRIVAKALVDVRNGDPVDRDGVSVDISDSSVVASKGGVDYTLPTATSASFVAFLPTALVVKLPHFNQGSCGTWTREDAIALPLK
jgi:hypothetical protein